MQKFARPPVGEDCRGCIVVKPIMPGERVALTRITVNGSVWLFGKCSLNLDLRRLGDEFVLFAEMHQQRSTQTANFAEIFFGIATMISDGSIDLVAGGYDKGHQCAKAVALHGNLAGRIRQRSSRADRLPDIFSASIAIISSVKPQTVLPVGFRGHVE